VSDTYTSVSVCSFCMCLLMVDEVFSVSCVGHNFINHQQANTEGTNTNLNSTTS
jgi:hypothetical protein